MSEQMYCGVSWADVCAVMRAAAVRSGVRYRDLDDHVQDAIERLLNAKGPQERGRRTVLAYVWKVSVFTDKDRARKTQCRPSTVPLLFDDESYVLTYRERGFDAIDALDLVRRLRPQDAEALMVAFLVGDGAPHDRGQAAEVFGISEAAAHQRISRARAAARRAA